MLKRRAVISMTAAGVALAGMTQPGLGQDGTDVQPVDELITTGDALPRASRSGLVIRLSADASHTFETSLDDGPGEMQVTSFGAAIGLNRQFDNGLRLAIGIRAGIDAYDFTTPLALSGNQEPWDDIQSFSLRAGLEFDIDDHWAIFGGPLLRFDGESGADFDDGFTGGGLIGARVQASSTFAWGLGVGVIDQLQDSADVFPVIIVDWEITNRLRLSNSGGGAAGRGGIQLTYDAARNVQLGVGASWFERRFRLDDDGPAPNGVGEDKHFPVFGQVTWNPTPTTSISARVGVKLGGKLELEQSDGVGLPEQDYSALMIGLSGSIRF